MKVASHCCWCPLPRMPSSAISKAISSICSCWHCDYLPWQLKPLAPNRASDAILMTLCPPSRAVLLPIYELLEPWWCASGEKHQTCQSCHSRDYHRCWSSPPRLREGLQVDLLLCLGCSAQIRENCFLPYLSCAFLHYYQCNPALYLECLSNFELKDNFSPFFLGIRLGTIWVTDPVFFSELPFPPLSTAASYWNKLVGWSCFFRQNFLVGTSSP